MGNLCCKRIVWFPGSRSLENSFDHFPSSKTELRTTNEDASCAIDELLEGRMDLEVVLPDSRRVRLCVERRTPMMDVLVRAASAHKLSPGGLVIQPPSSSHDDIFHAGRYKPSTPIGALDVATVFVIPKKDLLADGKKSHVPGPRRCPPTYRGQDTFRMSIHLPGHQLAVARVSSETTASQLTARVCGEKGLDPQRYRLVHPHSLDKPIDKDTTMKEYGDTEINLLPISRIKEQTCFQNSNCFGLFCGDATLPNTKSISKSAQATHIEYDRNGTSRKATSGEGSPQSSVSVIQEKKQTFKKRKRLAPSPPTLPSSLCISTNDEDEGKTDDDGRTDEDDETGVISSSSSSGVSSFDGGGLPASTLSLLEVEHEQSSKPKRSIKKTPAPPPPPVRINMASKHRRAPTPAAYRTSQQDDSEEGEISEPCPDIHQTTTGPSCEEASEPLPVTRQEIASHIENIFHSFLLEDEQQPQATTPRVKEEKEEAAIQPARALEVIGHSQATDDRTSLAELTDSGERDFFWPASDHESGSLPRLASSCESTLGSDGELSRDNREELMREHGNVDSVVGMPVNAARTLRQTHSLPNGAGEFLDSPPDEESSSALAKEVVVGGRSPFMSRSLSCEPSDNRNGTLHRALIDIPLLYVDPLLEQNSASFTTTCATSNKAYTSSLRSSTNKTRFKPPQVRTTGKCRQRLPPEMRKEYESSLPSVRFEVSHPKTNDSEVGTKALPERSSSDNPCTVFNDKTNLMGVGDIPKKTPPPPPQQLLLNEESAADPSHRVQQSVECVISSPKIKPSAGFFPPPPEPRSQKMSRPNDNATFGGTGNCRDALLQEIINFGKQRALKNVIKPKSGLF